MSIFCKVYGVAMCYNEVDFIETFIRNVRRQLFDGLVILDHFSNDGTMDILQNYKIDDTFDFHVLYTKDRVFDKVKKINGLAAMANFRAWADKSYRGKTWIVPMDIDELWACEDKPLAEKLKEKIVLGHSFYNHMRNYINTTIGYDKYYLTPNDYRQQIRNEKCCFVWHPDIWCTSGFHNLIKKDQGQFKVLRASWLIVKHYPYRSYVQVRNKYINLREAILMQQKRDSLADRHSVERGGFDDSEFMEWYHKNCFVSKPADDKGLIREEA